MLGLLDFWIEGFGLWGFTAAAAAAARHVDSHDTCHMPQRQSLSLPLSLDLSRMLSSNSSPKSAQPKAVTAAAAAYI